jgi:23S rRNA (adenine-N6)-dimethyltransferase
VAGRRERSHQHRARDERRRSLGQNFLVDRRAIRRVLDHVAIEPGELVVDIGAGTGALAVPCADAGARVIAIEHDPVWAERLRAGAAARDDGLITVVHADARTHSLPDEPFRVVASPPFSMSSELLGRLLDHPDRGPYRCDVVLQLDVVRKRATGPPGDLRTAAWAPWWRFEIGPQLSRTSFRPVPAVDAAVLTIHQRTPSVLPGWMAPEFVDTLRPLWQRHHC